MLAKVAPRKNISAEALVRLSAKRTLAVMNTKVGNGPSLSVDIVRDIKIVLRRGRRLRAQTYLLPKEF